jgi:shikimate dehydrogenase
MKEHESRTYCVIGDPVYNSLSPAMHNAAFNSLNLNYTYIAFRVPRGELKESVSSLRAINISGFNVTIPHKVDIINFLDDLDDSAKKAKAVNTVNNVNGHLKGYNTDVYGFIQPLRKRNINFKGKKILVLGAGGAARAVIAALSDEKQISDIIVSSRNQAKGELLIKIAIELGIQNCRFAQIDRAKDIASNSDMIINTTPIGMNDEETIIDYEHINKKCIVYDIVYKPVLTNLLQHAKYVGAELVYGHEMLLEQGAKSFEIWTGRAPPLEAMKKALFGQFSLEKL